MPSAEDRDQAPSPPDGSRQARIATASLGGLLGGLAGGALVLAVTVALKASMDLVSAEATVEVIVVPLLGLALTTLILHVVGRTASPDAPHASAWRTFPPDAIRADITGDVVDSAGVEERFPWRLAPLRTAAIFATVGLGAAMGTEAPAAYIGVATGAGLGDRGRRWRRLLRPAALAAGAAGVSAVMGVAAVGTAYMLELGRRHRAPLSTERVIAAVIGGVAGWGINAVLGLSLIRLIVPRQPPDSLLQAVKTALFIGAISGAITAVAGSLIYRAKKWHASPMIRLALGGLAMAITAVAIVAVAVPTAAVGPGGGAILWAENAAPVPLALLAVALLRAAATTAAVAAGGCGGVFVPFLAVGDLAGRVFAPGLAIGDDLAGAAGAAAGIAGGYRLPFTAMAMSLGIGGPRQATLTCLATIVIASVVGAGAGTVIDRVTNLPYLWKRRRTGSRP
ncbi:MAG TPA: chloride channel protein [Kofleriaceae bacterium]|jgi:H+/Cl- antiporter ClcA|nr:chloride channel protein [Kofleriaceae bacterium]